MVSDHYQEAILKGTKDGMSLRFPNFPENGSIWITEVAEHPFDSSQRAFDLAARSVIDQAYSLAQVAHEQYSNLKNLSNPL